MSVYVRCAGDLSKGLRVSKKIRVLVVDDSALVREILSKGLAQDPGIEVVGTAPDPYAARDKIVKLTPDVLTLDVEMPRMDGVEFLRKLMPQYPLPVVMVSALTERGKRITLDALEAGAVDFVTKPGANLAEGLATMMLELRTKVKIASGANVAYWKHRREEQRATASDGGVIACRALDETTDKVIAIGASTGGTQAITSVVTRFPANAPGIVIVQHMPAGFTKMFAERLNGLAAMEVKEAENDDRVMHGRVLIAPGDHHMEVVRSGGVYRVRIGAGEKVCGHRPSVEVLMRSVAREVGANAIGVMLTGMGGDGADGIRAMREAGAKTIGQDEASCVVYGMPKVAFERGGIDEVQPLDEIAGTIITMLAGMTK